MRQLLWGFVFSFSVLFTVVSPHRAGAQDACAKACVIHAECGIGGLCDQGSCKYQAAYCGNERWSVNSRGETQNCDAYRCSPASGLCLRQAENANDCLNGYVYNGKDACVPSIQCNLADAHCQDLYERWKTSRAEYEATMPEPTPAPLSCIACDTETACASHQMCWKGLCTEKKAYCEVTTDGEHLQKSPDGQSSSCGSYICEKVSSQCLTTCQKKSDCRQGRNCLAGTCL